MVGGQPRIAALSYPLPWLRDSVFIIHSLDLAGFHDLTRADHPIQVSTDTPTLAFTHGERAWGDLPARRRRHHPGYHGSRGGLLAGLG